MTSKSNYVSLRFHLYNTPVQSSKFRIHLNADWSVLTVNLLPYRYGLRIKSANKTAKHSLWIVLYERWAFVSVRDQYPMGRLGPSSTFWRSKNPTCLSQTSFSRKYSLFYLDNESTGVVTSLCCSVTNAPSSSSFKVSNVLPFSKFQIERHGYTGTIMHKPSEYLDKY